MRTVLHLIQDDPENRDTALLITANLLEDDSVEMDEVVVAQGPGIEPLTSDGEGSDRVRELLDDGVSVRACGNTLDLMDLEEADLVEGAETVPSGAGELTRLQDDGYAYIRP